MRFTWKILLDSLDYSVDLFYSKLSTKVKVLVNGELALSTKATEQQVYKFLIRYRTLAIVRVGDLFDLRWEKLSAQAILTGKQSIKPNRPSKSFTMPKVQLRRSLPTSYPSETQTVNFRKTAKNADLLDFGSSNPFDCIDDSPPVLFKTSSMRAPENQVPWPATDFFSAPRK